MRFLLRMLIAVTLIAVLATAAIVYWNLSAKAAKPGAFSVDMFRRLAEKAPGNLVVSPYSLECALAAAAYGAAGETEAQMLAALRLQAAGPGKKEAAHAGLGGLSRRLAADGDVFSTVTMLAHAKEISLREAYRAGIAGIYRSSVRAMDFSDARRAAALVVTRPASKPREFTLDSPFVFLVRHAPTGAVILLGRVDRPDMQ